MNQGMVRNRADNGNYRGRVMGGKERRCMTKAVGEKQRGMGMVKGGGEGEDGGKESTKIKETGRGERYERKVAGSVVEGHMEYGDGQNRGEAMEDEERAWKKQRRRRTNGERRSFRK